MGFFKKKPHVATTPEVLLKRQVRKRKMTARGMCRWNNI